MFAELTHRMKSSQNKRCNQAGQPPESDTLHAEPRSDRRKSGSQYIPAGTIAKDQESSEKQHTRDNQTNLGDSWFHHFGAGILTSSKSRWYFSSRLKTITSSVLVAARTYLRVLPPFRASVCR